MMETTFIKTAMGDRIIGYKNKDAKETLHQTVPPTGFLKFEEKCVDYLHGMLASAHR